MAKKKQVSMYQTHSCQGFQALVTVELYAPPGQTNGAWFEKAEDIADAIIAREGPKTREMVQAMRGKS